MNKDEMIDELKKNLVYNPYRDVYVVKSDNLPFMAERLVKLFSMPGVSDSLLERAASLVGNPGTNISGSTDLACEEWQKDYERWRNDR